MVKPVLNGAGFKIGLFAVNCSGGLAATCVPERWSGSWDDNLRLAGLADRAGLDFLLPVARWTGYHPSGDRTHAPDSPGPGFQDSVLDPVVWAGALLARTCRITVFSTVHAAFHHPVATAKQLATVDHVGGGRAGLNIVAGWNAPEYRLFGLDLPASHAERYALAQEWWSIIHRVWTAAAPFDHHGRFFHLTDVEGLPIPVKGIPPILNAGVSEHGQAFAARNADVFLTNPADPTAGAEVTASVQDIARTRYQRRVVVFATGHVVCRPTQAEADDFLRYYAVEGADHTAVENLAHVFSRHSAESLTAHPWTSFQTLIAAGHGTYPLIGTPDTIADRIADFYQAGFAGIALSFVNYLDELDYFAHEVLPRLSASGIRPHST